MIFTGHYFWIGRNFGSLNSGVTSSQATSIRPIGVRSCNHAFPLRSPWTVLDVDSPSHNALLGTPQSRGADNYAPCMRAPTMPDEALLSFLPALLPADIHKHPIRTRSYVLTIAARGDERGTALPFARFGDDAFAHVGDGFAEFG